MLKNVRIYKELQLPLRSVLGRFGSSYPLFTRVRGRGILRSPCPESCIAPALTGQDHLTRPPLLDRGYPHIVAGDRYAPGLIGHAVLSRRAHGLATRDPREDR